MLLFSMCALLPVQHYCTPRAVNFDQTLVTKRTPSARGSLRLACVFQTHGFVQFKLVLTALCSGSNLNKKKRAMNAESGAGGGYERNISAHCKFSDSETKSQQERLQTSVKPKENECSLPACTTLSISL